MLEVVLVTIEAEMFGYTIMYWLALAWWTVRCFYHHRYDIPCEGAAANAEKRKVKRTKKHMRMSAVLGAMVPFSVHLPLLANLALNDCAYGLLSETVGHQKYLGSYILCRAYPHVLHWPLTSLSDILGMAVLPVLEGSIVPVLEMMTGTCIPCFCTWAFFNTGQMLEIGTKAKDDALNLKLIVLDFLDVCNCVAMVFETGAFVYLAASPNAMLYFDIMVPVAFLAICVNLAFIFELFGATTDVNNWLVILIRGMCIDLPILIFRCGCRFHSVRVSYLFVVKGLLCAWRNFSLLHTGADDNLATNFFDRVDSLLPGTGTIRTLGAVQLYEEQQCKLDEVFAANKAIKRKLAKKTAIIAVKDEELQARDGELEISHRKLLFWEACYAAVLESRVSGHPANSAKVYDAFKKFDCDHDNMLSLAEFSAMAKTVSTLTDADVQRVFPPKGFIGSAELTPILANEIWWPATRCPPATLEKLVAPPPAPTTKKASRKKKVAKKKGCCG